MKNIQFDDADKILSWKEVADALESGHRLTEADVGDMLLSRGDQSFLNRGAWIPELGLALKSITVFPDNPQALPPLPTVQSGVLLFDPATGTLKALIDGSLVTKWKTAADSVLGARLLANPGPKSLLILGAGIVAKSLVSAYNEVFPSLTEISIWSRTVANAEELAADLVAQGYPVQAIEDVEAAAGSADIISTATMAKSPILHGDWVSPGTHVDLIGAYRLDMREADDVLIKEARLFVDSRETTLDHIGELAIPLASGLISRDQVLGDLYDLCNGRAGRRTPEEITVFKNGGGAHLDLMTAQVIYDAVS